MTTTLVVLAHPEPRSFCGQWAGATARATEAEGHRVLGTDLSGFDPVEHASHYAEPGDPLDLLEPVLVHGVHGYHKGDGKAGLEQRLRTVLAQQAELLRGFDHHPRLAFNADSDFDEEGRLRHGAPSFSPFIRRDYKRLANSASLRLL